MTNDSSPSNCRTVGNACASARSATAAALIVAKLDGMEYEDAWEWLSYNASGTVVWLHELERVLES